MRTLAVALAMLAAGAARAADADAVERRLERDWPVEVLRLEPVEVEGRAAFAATVMVRPGDYNDAMSVARLVVDAETGALLVPPEDIADASGPRHRPRREGMGR